MCADLLEVFSYNFLLGHEAVEMYSSLLHFAAVAL